MTEKHKRTPASLRTEQLEETENGTVFRTVLPTSPLRNAKTARRSGSPGSPAAALRFTLTPEGALKLDNSQPEARRLRGKRLSLAMAAAMREAVLARNPNALSGRTLRGMAFELRVHCRAYRMGLKRSHAAVTELGGLDPAAPDFDDNAAWFERPLRSLPSIGKALLRR